MNNRFIKIHENEIQYYRDNYYQNIVHFNKTSNSHPVLTFLIPLIVSQLMLIHFEFSIKAYIISILVLIITNTMIYFIFTSRITKNEYLEAIMKYGYRSIEEYEKKVKKYITGPEGYYHTILLENIEKYNINSSTKKIRTKQNEEYYIWRNNSKLYLLGTHSNKKPEVITIPVENIRYYRIDDKSKSLILKTKENIFLFKEKYVSILDELIQEKNINKNKNIEIITHINDYENYMHKIKKSIINQEKYHKEKIIKNIYKTVYYLISISMLIILTLIIPKISYITNIINCLIIILLNLSITKIPKHSKYNKTDLNKLIISNKEITSEFEELKYALGINDKYDSVYTLNKEEYIIWASKQYIHLFLNKLNYNCTYISVKKKDVEKTSSETTCSVKLKNKKIILKKESEHIFDKTIATK